MTAFAAAYLIVWLALTAYCGRLIAHQCRMSHLSDREASKQCS